MKCINWSLIIDLIIKKIDQNYNRLSEMNSSDSGKSTLFSNKENDRCKQILEIQKNEILSLEKNKTIKYLSRGTILILTPISSAYTSILHKLIPSLYAGNKVIIKSSEFTVNCSRVFVELIKECLPDSLSRKIIYVSDLLCIKDLISNQSIDALLFTGKSETAKEIKGKIGRIPAIFETGSMALAYVDSDVNIKDVAKKVCENSFAQNGMRCIGLKNLFINSKIYESLKNEIISLVKEYQKNDEYIKEFKNQETKMQILENINKYTNDGYITYTPESEFPILIEDVVLSKNMFLDEMYGPVLCLHEVENFKDIPTPYYKRSSLCASVYTSNQKVIDGFINYNRYTGTILINKGPAIRYDDRSFGGFYDENENMESFKDVLRIVSYKQNILQ